MEFVHQSVLLQEVLEQLAIQKDGIYVDGTVGGGGHAYEICKRLGDTGRLIGLDQDQDAILAAHKRLQPYLGKVELIHSNYQELATHLREREIAKVNGILLDLGVSSYQLDAAERGFTYRQDAPLDMRMDQTKEKTAEEIVNHYEEGALYQVIRQYGEEPFAKQIARRIVLKRKEEPIKTTGQLVEIILSAIPMKARKKQGHPAKRTFQAIRIELNQELEVLQNSIVAMIDLLEENGRLCIITFHSLEDRIVKNLFREQENPCICPSKFPVCVCNRKTKGKVITRKPILPKQEEIQQNKRAKSAKLRVFEKLHDRSE